MGIHQETNLTAQENRFWPKILTHIMWICVRGWAHVCIHVAWSRMGLPTDPQQHGIANRSATAWSRMGLPTDPQHLATDESELDNMLTGLRFLGLPTREAVWINRIEKETTCQEGC